MHSVIKTTSIILEHSNINHIFKKIVYASTLLNVETERHQMPFLSLTRNKYEDDKQCERKNCILTIQP